MADTLGADTASSGNAGARVATGAGVALEAGVGAGAGARAGARAKTVAVRSEPFTSESFFSVLRALREVTDAAVEAEVCDNIDAVSLASLGRLADASSTALVQRGV